MKSLAAIVAAWLVTVGAANASEIVIKPKPSDSAVVLTISESLVEGSAVGAAKTGEIVIKPKLPDSAVVLTISGGKVVKANVRAKPEHMTKPEPVKHTAVFARTP
jgi:hypothetical protein